MNNYCPLGFECVFDECISIYGHNPCVNSESCYRWTTAWELPYYRHYIGHYNSDCWDYNYLIVSFLGTYSNLQNDLFENPITSQYNWRKYFAEYGFAEAVALPYFFRNNNNAMIIYIVDSNICREEIQKTGYANAISLPLQKRKEYYSDDTYDAFIYQEVDLFFCGDEAINALNAGYANAVELLPTPLDKQKWEYSCCENED